MKRKLALILLLCLIFSITAGADMIVEPTRNDFMREHSDECVQSYRYYTVNSPAGGAYLYDQPNGKIVDVVQNGGEIYTAAIWNDGTWILMYSHPSLGSTSETWVWIKQEDVVAVYDRVSFNEEFSSSFYQDEALVQQFLDSLQDGEKIWSYDYPGAVWPQDSPAADPSDKHPIEYLFEDESGLIWGHLSTWDWWICLSDPYEKQEVVDRQKAFELYPSWEEQGIDPMESIKTEKRNEVALVATMVAGVAVVSLVQIVLIRKKKKQKAAG